MTRELTDHHLSELARGATSALSNAEDLFREAAVLFACGAFARALFLHQISMEECGKIEILGGWASSHLMGMASNERKVGIALASHKAKNFANSYMLPASDAEKQFREDGDWEASLEAFKDQQVAFHEQANTRKNASLYVDFVDGTFYAPRDRITEEMVHDLASRNSEFIELLRPKVRMLARWAQEPEDARDTMSYFQSRMEELREKLPDDPQQALDIVLAELLTQAKTKLATEEAPQPNDA